MFAEERALDGRGEEEGHAQEGEDGELKYFGPHLGGRKLKRRWIYVAGRNGKGARV